MSKSLILVIVGLVICSFIIFSRVSIKKEDQRITVTPTIVLEERDSEEVIASAIAEGFSKKYKRPADAFILSVDSNAGLFAKGGVEFKGEFGRGLWFGAKTAEGWELAFDGQGIMSCETATMYNFPKDLVPACIDIPNGNVFTER